MASAIDKLLRPHQIPGTTARTSSAALNLGFVLKRHYLNLLFPAAILYFFSARVFKSDDHRKGNLYHQLSDTKEAAGQ